jgi:hypothetical protein
MIKSVTHCTSNEDGEEELTIRRSTTFVEDVVAVWKTRSFSSPDTVTEVYIVGSKSWVDKKTGASPGPKKQAELTALRDYNVRQKRMIDFGLKF